MEIVQELRTLIRTPENGPYQGHFIQAVKRSGNVCIYKHRDYEDKRKVFGYYVFTLCDGHNSDNLPEKFGYWKSKQSAYNNLNRLVEVSKEPIDLKVIPNMFEKNGLIWELKRRSRAYCVFSIRGISQRRSISYVYFKVKINKNKEEVPPSLKNLKQYHSFASASSLLKSQMMVDKKKQEADNLNVELIAALKERISDMQALLKDAKKREKIALSKKSNIGIVQ